MEQLPSNFWQANLWGIIGTVTGLAGMLISWLTFKYNTPEIEIDKMDLVIPDWMARDWKGKTTKELDSSYLKYELEIVVRNKRGGAGSIDKPNLLIKIPDGKKFFVLSEWKQISIPPQTEHSESQKESENVTSIWTVRHGRAFNVGAGEKVDEKLEYHVSRNPEMIYSIIQNFEELKYYVEYLDNHGNRYEKKIERIFNESARYN